MLSSLEHSPLHPPFPQGENDLQAIRGLVFDDITLRRTTQPGYTTALTAGPSAIGATPAAGRTGEVGYFVHPMEAHPHSGLFVGQHGALESGGQPLDRGSADFAAAAALLHHALYAPDTPTRELVRSSSGIALPLGAFPFGPATYPPGLDRHHATMQAQIRNQDHRHGLLRPTARDATTREAMAQDPTFWGQTMAGASATHQRPPSPSQGMRPPSPR